LWGGAFRNDWQTSSTVEVSVSRQAELSKTRVAIWAEACCELTDQLKEHVVVVSDLNAILNVAEGKLDAVIDTTGKLWDHAPHAILIEEAGGDVLMAKAGIESISAR